jgi:predicted nucleotidyltransferase component of viral defense system
LIDRQEILEFSRELGLAPDIVEKDYVLGWVLAGIYNHSALKTEWVFKGGTCLKKCYFETYRFSEDLDFTLKNTEHLKQQFLNTTFAEVAAWIYEHSGIGVPADSIRFEVYTNPRGKTSVQGRVGYLGPMQRRGSVPRVKLDLTDDERLVLPPATREVHHPYSDKPDTGIQALCYLYEELFAEKVRALAERMRPRDLYDVIHLYRHEDTTCDRSLVVRTLKEKCDFKGIPVPTAEALRVRPERAELEAEWHNMLAHQLPRLPPLAQFFDELPRVFSWLFEAVSRPVMAPVPIAADEDAAWRPPAMVTSWGFTVPLEIIRFAAANHLCVDLSYQGSHRLIEPYSLRQTRGGNIVLHAIRNDSGEHRSYRVDRIEGASATATSFTPRYAIELTTAGPLSIPSTASRATSSAPRWHFGGSTGRTYVIQCTICGRRFNRKSYDTSLNPHKNKSGYGCFSRTGIMVEAKY